MLKTATKLLITLFFLNFCVSCGGVKNLNSNKNKTQATELPPNVGSNKYSKKRN